jgi:hypothetical protein
MARRMVRITVRLSQAEYQTIGELANIWGLGSNITDVVKRSLRESADSLLMRRAYEDPLLKRLRQTKQALSDDSPASEVIDDDPKPNAVVEGEKEAIEVKPEEPQREDKADDTPAKTKGKKTSDKEEVSDKAKAKGNSGHHRSDKPTSAVHSRKKKRIPKSPG